MQTKTRAALTGMALISLLIACGGQPETDINTTQKQVVVAAEAWLAFYSDPGDFIGQGQNLFVTSANVEFDARQRGDGLQFNINRAGPGAAWTLILEPRDGQALAPGVYLQAQRFGGPANAGLDFGGNGRGCNGVTGEFLITDLQRDAAGEVRRIFVKFEQHCEGRAPALVGYLSFKAPAADGDGDGVGDAVDKCPCTAKGYPVDSKGCSKKDYALARLGRLCK